MERYAITFGEAAIVHIGSAEIGKMKKEGFTVKELLEIQSKFDTGAEFIDLSSKLPKKLRKDNMAGVLVIRDGLNKIFNSDLEFAYQVGTKDYSNYDKCRQSLISSFDWSLGNHEPSLDEAIQRFNQFSPPKQRN